PPPCRAYCDTGLKTIASGGELTRWGVEMRSRAAHEGGRNREPHGMAPALLGAYRSALPLRASDLVRSVAQYGDARRLPVSPLDLDDVAGADGLQIGGRHGRPLTVLRAQELPGALVDLHDRHPRRLHLIGQAR